MACAADLVDSALSRENVNVAYITLNRRSAKRIIWKDLLIINKDYNLGGKPDKVELTITFPNGSVIYLSGAKDEAEIEKLRGMAFLKIYIDEAQAFKAYLDDFINEILSPCLFDYDGSLSLIGTPNASCAGVFFDACHKNEGYVGWSNHHWTIFDNPWIREKSGKDPRQILKEDRDRKGWSEDEPAYRREALGEWVYDPDSLVFKYDEEKNSYVELPSNIHWEYIMAVDIGYVDADAISIVAFSYNHPEMYVVEEFIKNKMTISELVDEIRPFLDRYDCVKKVMDAGALGKKIQEEIRQRHGIHFEAAEKTRKHEYISLMNGDLRKGHIKVKRGSTLVADWRQLQWTRDKDDPSKWKIDRGFHSDIADSVLYAWREARHFTYREITAQPKKDTDEFMDMLADKEAEEMDRPDKEFWEEGISVTGE